MAGCLPHLGHLEGLVLPSSPTTCSIRARRPPRGAGASLGPERGWHHRQGCAHSFRLGKEISVVSSPWFPPALGCRRWLIQGGHTRCIRGAHLCVQRWRVSLRQVLTPRAVPLPPGSTLLPQHLCFSHWGVSPGLSWVSRPCREQVCTPSVTTPSPSTDPCTGLSSSMKGV